MKMHECNQQATAVSRIAFKLKTCTCYYSESVLISLQKEKHQSKVPIKTAIKAKGRFYDIIHTVSKIHLYQSFATFSTTEFHIA